MFYAKLKDKLKKHYIALIFAFFIGLLYISPHIFFIASLGDSYQNIPMAQTANEVAYLARMREILDGHPSVGSLAFYEYKHYSPMTPPIGEILYTIPSLFFGVDITHTLIATKFILPVILFLLVYFLIFNLVNASKKISSIAGASLVVLGYDLVDYRGLFNFFFKDGSLSGDFLLWSRPVNPILGAIFLFSFLLAILSIIKKRSHKKIKISIAALFLALMIVTYFFSWGISLSVLGILFLIYILKKEYQTIKRLIYILVIAILITLPYFYKSYIVDQNSLFHDSSLRNGLIYSHYYLMNKILLVALFLYIFIIFIPIIKNIPINNKWANSLKESIKRTFKNWHFFCLALILGSIMALNQQIITGMTIWPYHFVQYTIPLSIVVLIVLLSNGFLYKLRFFWTFIMVSIIGSSILFGVYSQIYTYQKNYQYYSQMQSYSTAFEWLNNQPKDSVVLINNELKGYHGSDYLILAYTHCNVYTSSYIFSMMPEDRIYHNYLIHLRLKGIKTNDIEEYLENNKSEYRSYLFSNFAGLHGTPEFPNFHDTKLEKKIEKFPEDYKQFLKKDFNYELKKYKLDYILSFGVMDKKILNEILAPKLVFNENNVYIYKY